MLEFPKCPVCENENLIPLSSGGQAGGRIVPKMFGHWICMSCGFCIGTGDTGGYEATDINTVNLDHIPVAIEEARERYKSQ